MTAFSAIAAVAALPCVAGAQARLDAIVEQDGRVVLCIAKGGILFADRCEGAGRLRIVQPLVEGPITWRGADGSITMENESPQNPDCALSKAKWDTEKERTARSGKQVRKVDGAKVLAQIDKNYPGWSELRAEDITAFAVDLDSDGRDEVIFEASNLTRVSDLHEKTQKPENYVTFGGILAENSKYPATYFRDSGEYSGGTDAIESFRVSGVVPLAPGTGEIALVISWSDNLLWHPSVVRYRSGRLQRIEGIGQRCH